MTVGSTEIAELYQRLDHLFDGFYGTHKQFAKHLGLTSRMTSLWAERRHMPGTLSVMKICATLNVSANWLLLGQGPMLLKDCEVVHA